ncbi:MAG: PKD domain-containing protein, partial [Chloroflexi bacterium]|nr:PKD domain-containing protein [Chloroflexota bacterium]
DTSARLTNLQATQQALISLLERAANVTEALSVQQELTRVQEEIERLQGRIKFLEETAAFSLINVRLRLAPVEMVVDAGPDQTFSVGQLARFRATFEPPEGIDSFTFTWDFGDGTQMLTASGTAPSVLREGARTTATLTHVYNDDRDSPFIVEVKITGTGDAGITEGSDTFIATVSRIPVIEVFAGNSKTADEGEEVEFSGSFTRPAGLRDLTYRWDFGDGTPPAEGSLAEGVTNAIATHVYSDHRPFTYTATLTIEAESDAGPVEASSQLSVFVAEAEGWAIAGWNAGATGKDAVRALSGVGQGLATFLIWLAIFSPIWVLLIGGVFVIRQRRRRSTLFP